LGGCLWKLAKYHNTVRNIELAISAYRKSLEFISHSWNPLIGSKESIEYATTQNNLGTCHKALASLKNPEENLSLAMKYFKESLYIAETTSQQRLVQVINQHLSELSNLADQMIFKKVSDSKLIEAQSQA
jgi:tetratricopeptide (TPR) repeat protein